MRLEKSAALFLAALFACRSPRSPHDSVGGSTLLFLGRSPAATLDGLSWAPDPEHSQIVAFDRRLHVAKRFTGPRLATPMAVATLGATLVVTERTGEAVVFDTAGRALREWPSPPPHVASLYAAGGGHLVAVRSPYYVPQFAPEADRAPLIRILDTLGRPREGRGEVAVPAVPFLAHLVNAGAVAVGNDGSVYFAPLVRDEIRKYAPSGALQWTAKRGLFRVESDPEVVARGKQLDVRKAVVNIAITLGPDGRLYVLGADDSAATRLRVDVLDTASGAILATRHLGPQETAVAVGDGGAIATFAAESLLAGAGVPPTREAFAPAFALPDLAGDTVALARFAGTVTLVNFWASWCDPCREEFPHMAALYREFDRKDFEIAAISDDVDRAKMRAFVREFGPPFPILVGGGRMKAVYHYRGLPYSVLLDRKARVIERIFGFGGAAEFEKLRDTIAVEVRAP